MKAVYAVQPKGTVPREKFSPGSILSNEVSGRQYQVQPDGSMKKVTGVQPVFTRWERLKIWLLHRVFNFSFWLSRWAVSHLPKT